MKNVTCSNPKISPVANLFSKSVFVMFSGALRVQREPLEHSCADLRRANETLAGIHDIVAIIVISWLTNYSLILARNFSVKNNFTREITKLLWQPFLYLSAKMASRFKDVTDEEVTTLKDAAENLNTRKSGLEKNPETVFPEQLDKVLERFFACVCKQDGTDYEPGSLKVMQAALDRHLKEEDYSLSITKDRELFNA